MPRRNILRYEHRNQFQVSQSPYFLQFSIIYYFLNVQQKCIILCLFLNDSEYLQNINIKLLSKRIMDHYQKKQQNFVKWNKQIWLSIEKEISSFQMKVTDCMLGLGDLKKREIKDYAVEPCLDDDVILGQEFYLENIRPQCVKKGYLPKKVPLPEDLSSNEDDQDSNSDQQEQIEQKKEQKTQKGKKQQKDKKKKGGKKGGHNNQGKSNQQKMKMQIVKENFQKDIQIVMSSHSMDRMQIQFGLKHKKLEVKLITFFYVAYFIRKNKQVRKIEEIQIFELINILIKMVRIFDEFKGVSFLSSEKKRQTIEVSPTLILDLKMCIKGLKEYYKYSNRKVIINYPKLVYYTNYDKFFPTLDVKPYPSQIQFIQAVKKAFNEKASIAHPTLILYRTMIGSGKTSASLALSNIIKQSKIVDQKNNNLQVVYSCLIGSVRVQVGRYAYNKDQRFALSAMEKSIKNEDYYYPRIIKPYRYKNVQTVDLIISDLDTTYQMLNYQEQTPTVKEIFELQRKQRKTAVNVGKLDKQNIILFIDQPTAFCKSAQSSATQKLFQILANYPPKLIVLASATMPGQEHLPNTIKLIEQRNPGLQVVRIESKQFQIGCQFCSFKGQVIFPHTGIKNKKQLENIINLLEHNPFLLRLYTGPSLFFLLKRCQDVGIKGLPQIDQLIEVRQDHITRATFKILKLLKKEEDSVIQQACKLAVDETNLDYKIQDEKSDSDDEYFFTADKKKQEDGDEEEIKQKQQKRNFVDFKAMIRGDAHKFLGGCLIGTSNPLEFARNLFDRWVRKIKPVKRLIEKYHKRQEQLQKQIKLIEDDKQMREEKKTKQISKLQSQKQALVQFPEKKRINTIDHYKKYCKTKETIHLSMLIKPVPLQSVGQELLDEAEDFVLKLLFCGVAVYMEKGLTPKYLDKVEELASQNYLAYIITDQSLCYGTNFPISNVILCDDLAEKLNMNQIFQLIGRAGRVGQSWTARAFLEPKGLQKLNKYIHKEDKEAGLQAQVFQQLALRHLNNPELTLRSLTSQIRYADIERPDKRIQVEIKKKKEDSHIFKNVVVIPFTEDGRTVCHKLPYQSLHYYEFPQSQILYEDIPTIMNSNQEQIIDISSYYKKPAEFIRSLLNKSVSRILLTEGIKIPKEKQLNEFKPKVYQELFNAKTNTFTVMFKITEEDLVLSEGSKCKLQKCQTTNDVALNIDQILADKLKQLVSNAEQTYTILQKDPTSVLATDVVKFNKIHNDLADETRPKTKFYRDIVNVHYEQNKKRFEEMTSYVIDKTSIECAKQSTLTLLIKDKAELLTNIDHHKAYIDSKVRSIWASIAKNM